MKITLIGKKKPQELTEELAIELTLKMWDIIEKDGTKQLESRTKADAVKRIIKEPLFTHSDCFLCAHYNYKCENCPLNFCVVKAYGYLGHGIIDIPTFNKDLRKKLNKRLKQLKGDPNVKRKEKEKSSN